MTYTTLAVIALICVSGFIAYFGDLLGRKMGKKRLTLFHMRPRYTAIVVTTITGMVISTLALAVLISINPTFSRIFRQGERIYRQNKQLAQRNEWLTKLGKDLRLEVARQEKDLKVALNDAVLAKKQRDLEKSAVSRLQKEIALRQSELADLRKQRDITKAELEGRRSELRQMQSQLELEQEQLRVAQLQVSKTQEQLGVAEAKLKKTQDDLDIAEAAFKAMTTRTHSAADYIINIRTNPLAFRQGDEMIRGIIRPAQSDFALRGDLYSLIDRASEKAVEAGAKVGPSGRAVNLIYRQDTGSTGVLFIDDERTCIDMALKKIASSKDDVLVQVVCGMNTPPDAQVPVELRFYVNELIFRMGETIAATEIDGRQSEGYILLALNSFLQGDVTTAAIKAGIAPIAGQDPRTVLGPNRQAQADELLGLVSTIKSMNGQVKVSVHSTADVYTADSLSMDNLGFGAVEAR